MNIEIDHLLRYLQAAGSIWKPSMESFVLEHGFHFTKLAAEQPKRGRVKQCYRNAALAVFRRPDWAYVEGYALGVIPLMHAWCVNQDREILELTWDGVRRRPTEYYGIPFNRRYLSRSLIKWGVYGLLENWKGKFPVQHTDRKEWIHPDYANHSS